MRAVRQPLSTALVATRRTACRGIVCSSAASGAVQTSAPRRRSAVSGPYARAWNRASDGTVGGLSPLAAAALVLAVAGAGAAAARPALASSSTTSEDSASSTAATTESHIPKPAAVPYIPSTRREAAAAAAAGALSLSDDEPPAFDKDPSPFDAVAEGLATAATYSANDPVEDRHVVRCWAPGEMLAAVFDGHGGWQAAEFAQRRMSATLQKELANGAANSPEQVTKALQRAFLRVEREYLFQVKAAFDLGFGEVARTGACALVTLLRGGHLFVANAGDCRAVLARRRNPADAPSAAAAAKSVDGGEGGAAGESKDQEASPSSAAALEAVPLSFDHNAREEREQTKLRALHPFEDDIIRCRRPTSCYVKGRLQPTRALGDAYLKYSEFNGVPGAHRSRGRYLPPPYTPPYITAEPEVQVHAVDAERDAFVIIGSDGLWDYLSNEEAVEVVAAAVEGGGRSHAAQQLVARVLEKAAQHHSLSLDVLRNLPPGRERRSRHDDVTCIVMWLDKATA